MEQDAAEWCHQQYQNVPVEFMVQQYPRHQRYPSVKIIVLDHTEVIPTQSRGQL
jgi:hypothetical protein